MNIKKANLFPAAFVICLLNLPFIILLVTLFAVLGIGFDSGMFDQKPASEIVTDKNTHEQVSKGMLSELPVEFNILVEAWDILAADYIDKD